MESGKVVRIGYLGVREVYFGTMLLTMLEKLSVALVAGFGLVATACAAQAKPLAPGDAAPEFSLVGSDGKTHRLSDLRGRFVVVAWFPKAFTGG